MDHPPLLGRLDWLWLIRLLHSFTSEPVAAPTVSFYWQRTRRLCETDYCKGFPSVTKRCYVTVRGSPRPCSRVFIGRGALSFLFLCPWPEIRATRLSFSPLCSSAAARCAAHCALEELLLLSTRTRLVTSSPVTTPLVANVLFSRRDFNQILLHISLLAASRVGVSSP